MNTFTPSGEITLVKAPLEKDYDHQLTFNSLTAQATYFSNLAGSGYVDYTYIKKDNQIRIGECIDDLLQFNYLFYRNNNGKTYYCFIDNMTYLNDNCTLISFSTDVIQTYLFDMDFTKKSLIDRQHVTDDTEGHNIVPENLDTGEYIEEYAINDELPSVDLCYVVALKSYLWDKGGNLWPYDPKQQKIPNGLYYNAFTNIDDVTNFIDELNAGKFKDDDDVAFTSEELYAVFTAYKTNFRDWKTLATDRGYTGSISITPVFITSSVVNAPDWTSTITYRNNGETTNRTYNIRNKKLMCYPYQFLQVNNKAGEILQFNYEDFYRNGSEYSGILPFYDYKGLSIGCSRIIFPYHYRQYENSVSRGMYVVQGQKLAVGSWVTDSYVNWMTQNSVNLGFTQIDPTKWGLISAGYDMFNGNYGSDRLDNVEGYWKRAFDVFQQKYQAQLLPNNIGGNAGNGDINNLTDEYAFRLSRMTLKIENLKRLDDYFDKFGYKVNEFDSINIHTRTEWNYLKTVECNIESKFTSTIPQEYLQKIKSIFNKGITFWHNPEHFLDYTQTNSIIS